MDSAPFSSSDFPWDSDAWEEVNQAPRHLHGMIRAICDEHTRRMGKTRVDMEVISVLKAEYMGAGRSPGGASARAPAVDRTGNHGGTATPAGSGQGDGGATTPSAAAQPAASSAMASLRAGNPDMADTPDGGKQGGASGHFGSNSEMGGPLDPFADLYAEEGVDPLTLAFARRSPPHITLPSTRVAPGQLQGAWLDALRQELPAQRRRSLYVHVPFCRSRCSYCPFYLMAYRESDAAAYVELLVRDIELTAAQIPPFDADSGGEYQAIFFGGGTPSDLSSEQLSRLLKALRHNFPLSRDCEITVEGRVAGFDVKKAQACRDAGATRISIGVQSFDTKVRQGVGRIADEAEVCRAMEALGAVDGLALNIDLIYGLPWQTQEVWEQDLARVNELTGIRGVDLYELKKIPGSPLARAQSMGRVAKGQGLAERAHMYAYGAATLEAAGWERLSCCHWGRDGNRQNRYNVYAKSGASCLPFGCCSGGRVGLLCMGGPQEVGDYRAALDRGEKPLSGGRRLSEMALLHDRVAGQLEFGRLDPEAVRAGLCDYLQPLLEQWTRSGLLERAGSQSWALTLAGRFWVKELSSRLALALH